MLVPLDFCLQESAAAAMVTKRPTSLPSHGNFLKSSSALVHAIASLEEVHMVVLLDDLTSRARIYLVITMRRDINIYNADAFLLFIFGIFAICLLSLNIVYNIFSHYIYIL